MRAEIMKKPGHQPWAQKMLGTDFSQLFYRVETARLKHRVGNKKQRNSPLKIHLLLEGKKLQYDFDGPINLGEQKISQKDGYETFSI